MMSIRFDDKKIFYPYVIQYLCSVHGYIELTSRQINSQIKELRDNTAKEQFDENIENLRHEKEIKDKLRIEHLEPTTLIGQISLKSNIGHSIEIDIKKLSRETLKNSKTILPFLPQAAATLLTMGFELTKELYDDRSVLWNFFYHCRNAAAHGGHFNITNKKRFPAKWNKLEIVHSLSGTPLFSGLGKNGLLCPGDALYLLHDIETIYVR